MAAVSSLLRGVGRALEAVGVVLQDGHGYVERLVPSTRVAALRGKEARTGLQNFVASSASLLGDVTLSEHASAWYGATLKGDNAPVTVGRGSAVLDNAVVSATASAGPAVLGADVTVCAGAVVQSASIGDGSMVGMGAKVLAGAAVGSDCFVDAGAVVVPGTRVPSGQLWTGSPARFLRPLQPDEMSFLRTTALQLAALGERHFQQGQLTVAHVEAQADERLMRLENSIPSDAPLMAIDPDVAQYYKLTTPKENSGLLRDAELNVAEELRRREQAEIAADKAEEEYYYAKAAGLKALREQQAQPQLPQQAATGAKSASAPH